MLVVITIYRVRSPENTDSKLLYIDSHIATDKHEIAFNIGTETQPGSRLESSAGADL